VALRATLKEAGVKVIQCTLVKLMLNGERNIVDNTLNKMNVTSPRYEDLSL
jgi:hypothetical protein